MTVFFNGRFVPERQAVVSVFDRGFLYGDALFEAMLVRHGRPFRWDRHIARLGRGLAYLQISWPVPANTLFDSALCLIRLNKMPECLLRLTISRGVGPRGYSPKHASNPATVISLHPLPDLDLTRLPRWPVILSSFRLPAGDPLSGFKTANKLMQILARNEADDAGAQEALLLNTKGFLTEGTTSNLFWIHRGVVCAPPLASGSLPGVTREAVFEICRAGRLPVKEVNARPTALRQCDGAFLSLTSAGIVEIKSLDGRALPSSPLVKEIWRDYRQLLARET